MVLYKSRPNRHIQTSFVFVVHKILNVCLLLLNYLVKSNNMDVIMKLLTLCYDVTALATGQRHHKAPS
jgi:hypothetical protein